jgi:hypothetical protein
MALDSALGDTDIALLRYDTTSQALEDPTVRRLWWQPPSWTSLRPPGRKGAGFRYARGRGIDDGWGFGQTVCDSFALLTPAQVKGARAEIRLQLSYWARRLGIRDGLIVQSIEPGTWFDSHLGWQLPQFHFVGYLLGQVPRGPSRDPQLEQHLHNDGWKLWIDELDPYLQTLSLRAALTRAFSWPAIMLFQNEQWITYRSFTRGLPLFRAMGRWRQFLDDANVQKLKLNEQGDPFQREPRHRRALRVRNSRRAEASSTEDRKLLAIATELWPQACAAATSGRRGRPPYRRCLQQLLAGRGIHATKRRLERVIAELLRPGMAG